MKNFIQPGNNITLPASPYAVDSGGLVLAGQLFGIACGDAENGAEVTIQTEGVFALPKPAADVFTLGAPVYANVIAQEVQSHGDTDSNSAGETAALIGVAVEAAGAGATSVKVKLSPSPVTLV
mgnify:CR=1 FL=1